MTDEQWQLIAFHFSNERHDKWANESLLMPSFILPKQAANIHDTKAGILVMDKVMKIYPSEG